MLKPTITRPRFLTMGAGLLFVLLGTLFAGQASQPGTASQPATATSKPRPATKPTTTSKPRTTKPATTAASTAPKVDPPPSIADMLKIGQSDFDAVAASDWPGAAKQSTALKAAIKKLGTELPKPDATQKKHIAQISADITAMDAAIKGTKQQTALDNANRIIRVSGVLADTFINKVPQSIWQMEYLARDLQVWSGDPADLTKLKAVPARIDAEWAKVSKEISTKGGDELVKEFADEMTALKVAAAAADYAKSTKPMLDTLNKIEKVYLK